jgi:hypothetical protein
VSLALFHPAPEAVREDRKKLQKDKPDDPASVTRSLEGKFGEALPDVRAAMTRLKQLEPGLKIGVDCGDAPRGLRHDRERA